MSSWHFYHYEMTLFTTGKVYFIWCIASTSVFPCLAFLSVHSYNPGFLLEYFFQLYLTWLFDTVQFKLISLLFVFYLSYFCMLVRSFPIFPSLNCTYVEWDSQVKAAVGKMTDRTQIWTTSHESLVFRSC